MSVRTRIVPIDIEVESYVCVGCGAEAVPRVFQASTFGDYPSSFDYASQPRLRAGGTTGRPPGWIEVDISSDDERARLNFCPGCAVAARAGLQVLAQSVARSRENRGQTAPIESLTKPASCTWCTEVAVARLWWPAPRTNLLTLSIAMSNGDAICARHRQLAIEAAQDLKASAPIFGPLNRLSPPIESASSLPVNAPHCGIGNLCGGGRPGWVCGCDCEGCQIARAAEQPS